MSSARRFGESILSVPGPGVSPNQATAPQGGSSLAAQAFPLSIQLNGSAKTSIPAGRFPSISVNAAQVQTTITYAGPYGMNCTVCSGTAVTCSGVGKCPVVTNSGMYD